jgi:hypothetical protein
LLFVQPNVLESIGIPGQKRVWFRYFMIMTMVQKFHEQISYVSFSKDQIQDKEKELKRDFNLLKEARKQSGVHWDDKLCMIIVDPPIWDNIIVVILFLTIF